MSICPQRLAGDVVTCWWEPSRLGQQTTFEGTKGREGTGHTGTPAVTGPALPFTCSLTSGGRGERRDLSRGPDSNWSLGLGAPGGRTARWGVRGSAPRTPVPRGPAFVAFVYASLPAPLQNQTRSLPQLHRETAIPGGNHVTRALGRVRPRRPRNEIKGKMLLCL